MAMDLVFDTLDGHSMEFSTQGCSLVRTGLASNIPAAVRSDPLMMLRAFEAVIQKISPSYPNVLGTRITKVTLRPAKGTNQAQFAVTYEGPPQLPKPQSRWVIEDNSTLATEQTELDLFGNVLAVQYQPPGQQPAPAPAIVNGIPYFYSGGGQPFDPLYHSTAVPVLRPRRQVSIAGWIIGRPGDQALDAMDTVNLNPVWGLKSGFWLCSHVSAKVEHAGATPFPVATQLYHVAAAFMSKVRFDWSNTVLYKNKFGQVPKELQTKEWAAKRLALLKEEYSNNQRRINGFMKVGEYVLNDHVATFGL